MLLFLKVSDGIHKHILEIYIFWLSIQIFFFNEDFNEDIIHLSNYINNLSYLIGK